MGSNIVIVGYNDLASRAPNIVTEWHPTMNGKLLCVAEIKENGTEYPYYVNKRVHEKLRTPKFGKSLLELDPVLVSQWHPSKNGDLKPNNVTLKTH